MKLIILRPDLSENTQSFGTHFQYATVREQRIRASYQRQLESAIVKGILVMT
jgi:hypothetical protein